MAIGQIEYNIAVKTIRKNQVTRMVLTDTRAIVSVLHYGDDMKPDIKDDSNEITDTTKLTELIKRLIDNEVAFTAQTRDGEKIHCLMWKIEK